MKKKILIINGPNLNMLGLREPGIYGTKTLEQLNRTIAAAAPSGLDMEFFQSNYEGAIIDSIHKSDADAVIINAGAYSHYSYAIYDALKCTPAPKIEVHMSDIYKRDETFRHHSVLTAACVKIFYGKGEHSYHEAVAYAAEIIDNDKKTV